MVALGDSFHDGGGPARLARDDRESLSALQRGRDWIWIAGNHDPEPAAAIGGVFETAVTVGGLTFRHLPTGAAGEIAGHLHPVARVAHRGRAVTRRCGTLKFTAHMLGERRLYAFAAKRCLPD